MSYLSKFFLASSLTVFTFQAAYSETSEPFSTTTLWPSASECAMEMTDTQTAAFSDETSDSDLQCSKAAKPFRITARHLEGNGIGFDKGYTSLDLFLSNATSNRSTVFADLRGHVFNDGKWAANAGLGFRYLRDCWAYGINAFYDFRDAKHKSFQQLGAGLEMLGKKWAFRLNGYFPLERKRTYFNGFDKFKGHFALFAKKTEYTFMGGDFKIERELYRSKHVDLSALVSGYYLDGIHDHAGGALVNVKMHITPYLTLQGTGSYDTAFHWRGSGEIALNLPFGRCKLRQECLSNALSERLVDPVSRFEIIPTKTDKKSFFFTDPNTGLPLFFVFINNGFGNSSGMFEDPFNGFAEVIAAGYGPKSGPLVYYVFEGTQSYPVTGFTVGNNQTVWGSGFAFTQGDFAGKQSSGLTIPQQTKGSPTLLNNSLATAAILLTQDPVLGGLTFAGSGLSVNVADATRVALHNITFNNDIETNLVVTGNHSYTNCQFNQGVNISLLGIYSLEMTHCNFRASPTATADDLRLTVTNGSSGNVAISNCIFTSGNTGLAITTDIPTRFTFSASENIFRDLRALGVLILNGSTNFVDYTFTSNSFMTNQSGLLRGAGIDVFAIANSKATYTLIDNIITNANQASIDSGGVDFFLDNNTVTLLNLQNNQSTTGFGGIPTSPGFYIDASSTSPRVTFKAPANNLSLSGVASTNTGSEVAPLPPEVSSGAVILNPSGTAIINFEPF